MLKYLIIFLKASYTIIPPKKNKILIYDRLSIKFAKVLFKKNSFITYDVRYESINLFILFSTIIKYGFKNFRVFKKNYKYEYFESVKPKIIYTSIDNNIGFFKLKHLYPKALYVADQNGIRDNKFFNECKKYNRTNKSKKLYTDIFFCFGNNEKDRLNKVLKGSILPLGNTLNNSINVKKKFSKISSLFFISSTSNIKTFLDRDIKIFKFLKSFCENKKIKLTFLEKPKRGNRYLFLKNILKEDFNYIILDNKKTKEKIIKKNALFVFIISTLGYEILSKGVKCVSLNHNQFNHAFKKYRKKGPFWVDAPSYDYNHKLISTALNKVINYNKLNWEKIYKHYSKQIMVYDKGNVIKLKNIKSRLGK
ncbi:hypothetical protein IDG78_03825 [Pelagibacterales bacterium SAG-MED05]|nr:hypothetical protein [Pelagibacterales bacterium SAG-MED05]